MVQQQLDEVTRHSEPHSPADSDHFIDMSVEFIIIQTWTRLRAGFLLMGLIMMVYLVLAIPRTWSMHVFCGTELFLTSNVVSRLSLSPLWWQLSGSGFVLALGTVGDGDSAASATSGFPHVVSLHLGNPVTGDLCLCPAWRWHLASNPCGKHKVFSELWDTHHKLALGPAPVSRQLTHNPFWKGFILQRG